MDRKTYKIFKKAYKMLRSTTPLNMDCGSICDKACCKGGDEKGMLLFPGEEEFLKDKDFLEIRPAKIELERGRRLCFAVCHGTCGRNYRPLSCMIFPLIPVVRDGKIFLEIDLRGKNTCPIVDQLKVEELFQTFIDKVYKTIDILQKLNGGLEFIGILSDIQNDSRHIIQKVTGSQP